MKNVSRRRKLYEPPETPHFFKIILPDALQSGKLMIPKMFVAKHGKSLPNQLLLKVAGDANWSVELEKGDERVWIGKGWRDFLDYYSIDQGHLIVFRYEGGSIFHVLIFDKSESEIERLASPKKLTTESDLFSKDQTKSRSYHSGERRSLKLKKNVQSYCTSRDNGGMIKESGKKATPFEQIHLTSRCPNPPDNLKKARQFKSEHPSFLIVMRPCYLKHSNLHVPSGFMKSQIKRSLVAVDATLEFRGGSWTVKFFNYRDNYSGKLSAGWAMFSTDNSLSTGDVCVFELIKKTPMVFRVSIFRHAG